MLPRGIPPSDAKTLSDDRDQRREFKERHARADADPRPAAKGEMGKLGSARSMPAIKLSNFFFAKRALQRAAVL